MTRLQRGLTWYTHYALTRHNDVAHTGIAGTLHDLLTVLVKGVAIDMAMGIYQFCIRF